MNSQDQEARLARQNFISRNRRWAVPIIDGLGCVAALKWLIAVVEALAKAGKLPGTHPYIDWVQELGRLAEHPASTSAEVLLRSSDEIWFCDGEVHVERRAISRMYAALGYQILGDSRSSRTQLLTACTNLTVDLDDAWHDTRVEVAISQLDASDDS